MNNGTTKTQFKDALQTWADIVWSFAKFDPKSQAILGMMGIIIYLACYQVETDNLRAEETEVRLSLKGRDEDPTRTHLIEPILHSIASETPSERLQRGLTMLDYVVPME